MACLEHRPSCAPRLLARGGEFKPFVDLHHLSLHWKTIHVSEVVIRASLFAFMNRFVLLYEPFLEVAVHVSIPLYQHNTVARFGEEIDRCPASIGKVSFGTWTGETANGLDVLKQGICS